MCLTPLLSVPGSTTTTTRTWSTRTAAAPTTRRPATAPTEPARPVSRAGSARTVSRAGFARRCPGAGVGAADGHGPDPAAAERGSDGFGMEATRASMRGAALCGPGAGGLGGRRAWVRWVGCVGLHGGSPGQSPVRLGSDHGGHVGHGSHGGCHGDGRPSCPAQSVAARTPGGPRRWRRFVRLHRSPAAGRRPGGVGGAGPPPTPAACARPAGPDCPRRTLAGARSLVLARS
jgi:hypothetical protein